MAGLRHGLNFPKYQKSYAAFIVWHSISINLIMFLLSENTVFRRGGGGGGGGG